MNCLEFRRLCLASPDCSDEAFRAHRQECSTCRDFAVQMRRFDQSLGQAMSIDVPHSLKSRILLRQSLQPRRWSQMPIYTAMAISVLIAVMVALWLPQSDRSESVGDIVLAYLKDSQISAPSDTAVTSQALNSLLRPLGMELDAGFGPVRAAEPCIIRGKRAAHLVLTGQEGKIDVVYMPYEYVNKRFKVSYWDRQVLVIPCPKGSIAIVGRYDETLAAVEHELHESSIWL